MIEREPAYSQESSERADLILDLGHERISTDVTVIHTTTPSRLSRSSPPINGLDAFGQLGKGAEELLGNLARKAETSGIAEYGVFLARAKARIAHQLHYSNVKFYEKSIGLLKRQLRA
jgi:hypothetical protein